MKLLLTFSLLFISFIGFSQNAVSNSKPPTITKPASKDGWWIKVERSRTEASQITFQIGTEEDNRRPWRVWNNTDDTEFDVPDEFKQVDLIYIHATVSPGGKNAYFCLKYKKSGIKKFDFDGEEDHQKRKNDYDLDCGGAQPEVN